MFVGLDVIGGFVTEINVTSPTGIRELDKQFGLNIGDLLMQAIERQLQRTPARRCRQLQRRMPRSAVAATRADTARRHRAGARPAADHAVPGGAAARPRDPRRHLQRAGDASAGAPGLEVLLVSDELPEARQRTTPPPISRSAPRSAPAIPRRRSRRAIALPPCRSPAQDGTPDGNRSDRRRRSRRQPRRARADDARAGSTRCATSPTPASRRRSATSPLLIDGSSRRDSPAPRTRRSGAAARPEARRALDHPRHARRQRWRPTWMPGAARWSASARSTTRRRRWRAQRRASPVLEVAHRRRRHAGQGGDPHLQRLPGARPGRARDPQARQPVRPVPAGTGAASTGCCASPTNGSSPAGGWQRGTSLTAVP